MNGSFWNPGDQILIWALNVVLQVGLVAAVATLIGMALRRSSAARYWLLCSAMLVVLVCPMLTAVVQSSGLSLISVEMIGATPRIEEVPPKEVSIAPNVDELRQNQTSDVSVVRPMTPTEVNPDAFERYDDQVSDAIGESVSPAPGRAVSAPASVPTIPQSPTKLGRVLRIVGPPLVAIWVIVAAVLLMRLFIQWHRLSLLLRSARLNTDEAFANSFQAACSALGIHSGRVPALVLSSDVSGPIAAGIRSPKVVFPTAFVRQINSEQLRDILIHEVAHIVRGDQLVVLLQNIVGAVFWIHPLVRLLNRQLAKAREEVCDNYVLAATDAPSYSLTLLTLAQLLSAPGQVTGAVGLFTSRWKLEHRVAGLLDARRNRTVETSLAGKLLVTLVAAMLTLLSAAGTMTLADDLSSQSKGIDIVPTIKYSPEAETEQNIAPGTPTLTRKTSFVKAVAQAGDQVVEPVKAPEIRSQWAHGKVLAVEQFGDRYDVRISIGEDDGIVVGLQANVYIGPGLTMPKPGHFPENYVASGQVVETRPDDATCNIGPTLGSIANGVPHVGDDAMVRMKGTHATFIVAKHVVLHDGKIIRWDEVRDRLAELNEEGLIEPLILFTPSMQAIQENGGQQSIEFGKWCEETTGGGFNWSFANESYDSITSDEDLRQTAERRIGTVMADGLPVADAEIVVYTSDDGRNHEVYIEHGRLRRPSDEPDLTHSAPNGRFAIYPQTNKFQILVLHEKGMALVNSDQWSNQADIELQPWASITGKFDGPIEFDETAQFETKFVTPGWATIALEVWDTPRFADRRFQNRRIPPGRISVTRAVKSPRGGATGIWHSSFELAPGEAHQISIGAFTEAGRKRAEEYLESEKQ